MRTREIVERIRALETALELLGATLEALQKRKRTKDKDAPTDHEPGHDHEQQEG